MPKTFSTKALSGTRVVGGKDGAKRIGKVRRFVFHPSEKRCVGFIVKRPDLLLMFHRKDLFVPLDAFEMEDGRVRILEDLPQATGPAACKRLGLDWDRCTLWEGMPVLTEGGEQLGAIGDVEFMAASGRVAAVVVRKGTVDKALLGELVVPAPLVLGFKTGSGGVELAGGAEGDEALTGAVLVSDDVLELAATGGAAEAAGAATARAVHKVREAGKNVKDAVAETAEPVVHDAGKAADEAVQKGAYVTGRQIGRATGMFKAFKDEYDKAVGDDGKKKR